MSRSRPKPKDQLENQPLLADLAALKTLTMPELRARWEALFGAPAPANRRGNLEQRLAWRLQELALGGPTPKTERSLDRLAEGGDASRPDPRLPAPIQAQGGAPG